MHDLELSQATKDLWNEVESLYGMSIELIVDDLPDALGYAEVLSNGRPRITIDNERGRSDQNITHELFHFKLRKEGYGQPVLQFPRNVVQDKGLEAWLNWNNTTIREPLLHRLFYPEVRQMGLEADEGLKIGVKEAMEEGEYLGVVPENAFQVHTGSFFRALIESTDQGFLSELEAWFIVQGWSESITLAKELRDFVEAKDPRTPRDEMETFVELLNRLYHDSLSFELSKWSVQTYGSHKEQSAKISIRVKK